MSTGILIKGGNLVDPFLGIDEQYDVGIRNGVVQDVEKHLSRTGYDRVLDASGKLVLPGLIDLHTHVAEHITPSLGISADKYCLTNGVTTSVDAGSTGELTFPSFRNFIIERSTSNILALLNIESLGMLEYPPERTFEEWATLPYIKDEEYSSYFINEPRTVETVGGNRDRIVGIKWAHRGPRSLRVAADISHRLKLPFMVENHHMPESVQYLKKGDVVTHIYHNYYNERAGRIDGILNSAENIHDEFHKAKKDGILFDVGHGNGSFSWDVASKALSAGLFPDIISTDLWMSNFNGPVFDLPTTMAKMKLLGMQTFDIFRAVTENPARVLGRLGSIGTLKPEATGDVVIMSTTGESRVLKDSYGKEMKSRWSLLVESVIKSGSVIV